MELSSIFNGATKGSNRSINIPVDNAYTTLVHPMFFKR